MRTTVWQLGILLAAATAARPQEGVEYFEKNIRPVLAARCLSCHGTKTAFAGLRLHSKAAAMKGSDGGAVIVPGDPAVSKLIRAVRGELKQRMPPTGALPPAEIEQLVRWVRLGAPWPDEGQAAPSGFDLAARRASHWCWQPVKDVPFRPEWLSSKSPEADRLTLLRRVTFDLTGLPPSPAEIRELERSGDYEAAVDRLLASERFGERMARRWMDVIRYSESHGSEGDPDTPMAWRYRDYLIRAFNQDVPYDQLVREHLAGDQLPRPRINEKEQRNESLLGTAHFRMVEHGFQPVDPWEDRVKWTDNQIDVFSKAFQGLTVSCARCHDHKFDAISQTDYYAVFGIFAGMRPTQVAVDAPEVLEHNREALAALKPRIRSRLAAAWRTELDRALETRIADASSKLSPLFPLFNDGAPAWFSYWRDELARRAAFNAKTFRPLFDPGRGFEEWPRQGAGLPPGPSPAGEFAVEPEGGRAIGGIYPAGVYSGLLSRKHGAALTSPRFKIESDSLSFRFAGGNFSFAQLIIENYAVPRGGIYNLRVSAKSDRMGWFRWDTTFWKGFTAYVEFATQEEATHFQLDDEDNRGKPKPEPAKDGRSWFGAGQVMVGDGKEKPEEEWLALRLLVESPVEVRLEAIRKKLRELLAGAVDAWEHNRMTDSQAAFLDYFVRRGLLSNEAAAIPEVAEYRRLETEIVVPRRAPGILEEAPPDHPLLIRGDHRKRGDPVPRGYLEALGGPRYSDARTTRLRLAEEIATPSNPLTARVMANRLWQYAFREGVVKTPDNFGRLGNAPADQELLDWLAAQFVNDGWSIKKMMRRLVTSPRYKAADLPARRLEAEEIRDAILAANGSLDLTMYGPAVPVFYAHDTGATKGDRPKGPLDGNRRRSIYLEVRRNATNPFLDAFDVYKPASTRGRRDVTNVPGQALALMNSPFVLEQAQRWADAQPDVEDLYVRVFGRPPTAAERERAETYQAEAGLANLTQALFNMKEFLYVR